MTAVHFAWSEVQAGAYVGVQRQLRALARNRQPSPGERAKDLQDQWGYHIEAAVGELALAKHLNVYWSDTPNLDTRDVGSYHVRHSCHADGHLLIYPEDAPGGVYVFVIGSGRVRNVAGWVYGHEAKERGKWRADCRRPCWWIPQTDLNAMDWLPEL